MAGAVYLVGAGPGAPDLITVRGARVLARADVVVYDRLVSRELLSLAPAGAELVYAGKEPGRHALSQDEINRILVEKALEGKTVVRLKGGDPLTFGRGEEECLYARAHGVWCEVVPGVPSYHGAAAEYMIPLAGRGFSSSFAVATGTRAGGRVIGRDEIVRLASGVDTLVLLMASRAWHDVLGAARSLGGRRSWVAVVERSTLPGSRLVVGTPGDLEGYSPSPPAVVFLGGSAWWRGRVWGAERS